MDRDCGGGATLMGLVVGDCGIGGWVDIACGGRYLVDRDHENGGGYFR